MFQALIAALLVGTLAGQLIQVRLFGIDIPIIDLALLATLVAGMAAQLKGTIKQVFTNPTAKGAVVMAALVLLSWIFALPALTSSPQTAIISGLYCLRLCGYLLLVPMLIAHAQPAGVRAAQAQVLIAGTAFAVIGFLQLAVFPDFEIFDQFGWDPHKGRLLSTFLDPNYASIYLSLILALALCLFLYSRKARTSLAWTALISFAANIATVSRTGLIALAATVLTFFSLVSTRITLFAGAGLLALLLLLPPTSQRIVAAINLDTTARFRLESWETATNLILRHPLLGVGYNALKFRRYENALPGTSRLINGVAASLPGQPASGSRADSGFDSSILTLLSTTGLTGTFWFLWWIWQSFIRAQRRSTPSAKWYMISTVALFSASWFVNAWLYPPILALWIIAMSLAEVE